MVEVRGGLVTQWNDLYPGVPFPTPDQNPQMFPQNFVIKKTVYTYDYSWWDDLWGDCCAFSRCCPKGLIDYQCQYNNNCILNLVNLGIHVIGFLLGIILLIILLGYASKLGYKFVVSAAFITKFAKCLSGCLKCFTFGVFDEKVYYKNQKPKAEYTEQERRILDKAEQLDLKIIISRLDSDKKKKLLQIFEDYEIVSDDLLCCNKNTTDQVQQNNKSKSEKKVNERQSKDKSQKDKKEKIRQKN